MTTRATVSGRWSLMGIVSAQPVSLTIIVRTDLGLGAMGKRAFTADDLDVQLRRWFAGEQTIEGGAGIWVRVFLDYKLDNCLRKWKRRHVLVATRILWRRGAKCFQNHDWLACVEH